MEVVVPDDQLSLAIGKKGQNVRLASRLTNWKLDVTSESEYNKALRDGYESLLQLPGVGDKLATTFYEMGFRAAEDVAKAQVADLISIKGISERKAADLIKAAISYVQSLEPHEEEAPDEEEEGVSGGLDG
jgi:N utilization substance protein A